MGAWASGWLRAGADVAPQVGAGGATAARAASGAPLLPWGSWGEDLGTSDSPSLLLLSSLSSDKSPQPDCGLGAGLEPESLAASAVSVSCAEGGRGGVV